MPIRHQRMLVATVFALLVSAANPARAEVGEVTVTQQYGVIFLPLLWMKHNFLIEKNAKAQGLEIKVKWATLAGPTSINDGLLSGAVDFSAVGTTSLITLWDKTKGNLGVMGVSAMTTHPFYLNVRNPNIKSIKDFTEKDRIAVPAVKSLIDLMFGLRTFR